MKTCDPNPFVGQYLVDEVAFYVGGRQVKEGELLYDCDGVKVDLMQPTGPVPDYLNKNWRRIKTLVPRLLIDSEVWMSLTNMELQSQYVPINESNGIVAVGGIGLGYVLLRMMERGVVHQIDAYESDSRVIEYWQTFNCRYGFEKVNVIEGPIRENMIGKTYDYGFVDTYKGMGTSEAIDDYEVFTSQNRFGKYTFWGMERLLADCMLVHGTTPELSMCEQAFLMTWLKTPLEVPEGVKVGGATMLRDMYEEGQGEEFVIDALERCGRL